MTYVLCIHHNEFAIVDAKNKDVAWKLLQKQYPDINLGDQKYLQKVEKDKVISFFSSKSIGKK
jgi:hypothetical protein